MNFRDTLFCSVSLINMKYAVTAITILKYVNSEIYNIISITILIGKNKW